MSNGRLCLPNGNDGMFEAPLFVVVVVIAAV